MTVIINFLSHLLFCRLKEKLFCHIEWMCLFAELQKMRNIFIIADGNDFYFEIMQDGK